MAAVTNETNVTDVTNDYDDVFNSIETVFDVRYAILIVLSVVGTTLNLWFLVAMLSSSEVRSRLRNKIICNSFVLHMVNCTIISPITIGYYFIAFFFRCSDVAIFNHVNTMHELVANWLLVVLLAVFVAQINDCNPTTRLSSGAATLGTIAILVGPWIAALIIVPVVMHEYKKYLPYQYRECMKHEDALILFRSIDVIAPILLAILLAIIAIFLKYRRFHLRNSSGPMHIELIGRGPEIDNAYVYVTAVIVSTVCDLPRMILMLRFDLLKGLWIVTRITYISVSETMSDARVVLMPIIWLLLPDVRERIKTWRPWYHPTPGIDLTVTYTKEETVE